MEHNNKIFIYNNFKIENAISDGDLLEIDGYCCHYNKVNLNGEMVNEASFKRFFEMQKEGKIKPALNYNHSDQLIGGIDLLESRKEGLYMRAHLNKKIALVRDTIIPCMEAGDLNCLSTEGYIMNGWEDIEELDGNSYYVKNFLLTAVAVVSVPADYEAKFTFRNFLQTHKQETPKTIYKSKWFLL